MRLLIETDFHVLDVTVADDVDLDARFAARCNDTGERLWINGWMIENSEVVPEEGSDEAELVAYILN